MPNENQRQRIESKEYSLGKIFSSDFEYHIPAYQRPYSWDRQNAEDLFNDLYDSYKRKEETYFLGSIVLIKKANAGEAYREVIDGQQRLITLTILFAAIHEFLQEDEREDCGKYVNEPGNSIEKRRAAPRLSLRDTDQRFFNEYIQNFKLSELRERDMTQLENASQRHVKENAASFYTQLQGISGEAGGIQIIKDFLSFIVTQVYLVGITTSDQDSALRIFSVLNTRGMPLLINDILKAEYLAKLKDETEKKTYAEKWEALENELGRDEFQKLFSYIRMIFLKTKLSGSVLDEFRTKVPLKDFPTDYMLEKVILPYGECLKLIIEATYKADDRETAKEINFYLQNLTTVDYSEWLPPAIKFLDDNMPDAELMLSFFIKLERLAACLFIIGKNENERIQRYAALLGDMDKDTKAIPESIELSDDEKTDLKATLEEDIYSKLTSLRAQYLIRRLNDFISEENIYYAGKFTIEHALPQNLKENSQWLQWWPDADERKEWTHKIANLVPLSRRKNSGAGNYEFSDKKDAYFFKGGATPFVLTNELRDKGEWMPAVVKERQKRLLDIINDNWQLS